MKEIDKEKQFKKEQNKKTYGFYFYYLDRIITIGFYFYSILVCYFFYHSSRSVFCNGLVIFMVFY